MKNFSNQLLLSIISLSLLGGCCSEDSCDDIETASALCDLGLTTYNSFVSEENQEGPVYTFINTITNLIGSYECEKEVAPAGTHQDKLQLLYSTTSVFDDSSEVVASRVAEIQEETTPNSNYQIQNDLQFAQDGYYKFNLSIDDINQVEERNELNNEEQYAPGSSSARYNNEVIHVTKDMVSKVSGKTTNNKIVSWNVKVIYSN